MKKTLFALLFVTLFGLGITTTPATAAPGTPIGPSPLPCVWQGQLYPHGAYRTAAVIGPAGQIIRYDVYQCQNAKWVYLYSSDDQN